MFLHVVFMHVRIEYIHLMEWKSCGGKDLKLRRQNVALGRNKLQNEETPNVNRVTQFRSMTGAFYATHTYEQRLYIRVCRLEILKQRRNSEDPGISRKQMLR